jgi:HD-like signal output (HDOD) protein
MRLLFVDDEPLILNGLQRMLRPMRNAWNMRFANSGHAAISLLQEESADVVVSDMRMPGMNGPQLLSRVAEIWPATIRIALSGQADLDMSCESTAVTHQYLSKPCELVALKRAVERAQLLRTRLSDPGLQALLGGLRSVPSLPHIYKKLTDELNTDNCSLQKVGKIISDDIAMTASILKIVNSAYFGLPREVSSPEEAAAYIGMDILKTLVLTTGIFKSYEGRMEGRLKLAELWQHSSRVAAVSKRCAQRLQLDRKLVELSYMAGMLHDVGVLLLAANEPDKYETALEIADHEHVPSWEAERRVFGTTHMEVGAYLLGIWNLPQRIVEATAFHHLPSEFGTPDSVTVLSAVHIAHAVADEVFGTPYKKESLGPDDRYLATLNLAGATGALKQEVVAAVQGR